MKIICDGADLSDAVLKVSKGTSNKTTNPILEGIKVVAEEDYVTLSATDLELSIEKTIKGMVQIEGEMVVPGKFFCEYIKKLNNEQIELTVDDRNMLSIKYTDSVGKIQCMQSGEFPIIKKLEDSNNFVMKQKDFKSLIAKSIYAVAVEDVRPILKGVKLEIKGNQITAVALDGYRLAVVKKPLVSTTAEFSCIVPARSLNEISKSLSDDDNDIQINVSRNFLMVDIDNTKITTRLLEGDFIDYNQIIPTNFSTTAILNKDQLLDALERASLLSRIDRNNLVRFDISDKVMILSSKSEIGDIKENITISLKGSDLSIAFNARYFTEALRAITDEFLKLDFTSAVSPCIITSNDSDEFLYLILPVRIMA